MKGEALKAQVILKITIDGAEVNDVVFNLTEKCILLTVEYIV